MKNRKSILTFAILAILILVVLIVAIKLPYQTKMSNLDFTISDSNNNYHFEINEKLSFHVTDSAYFKERKLTWYFGNGDIVNNITTPDYAFNRSGAYMITLEVDDQYRVNKFIDVIKIKQKRAIDSVPRILAPDEVYVGEEVVYNAMAEGADAWFWEFGESGSVDAYDSQAVYVYKKPGVYNVSLKTNSSRYPVYHRINVMPLFEVLEISEPIDSLAMAAKDIQEHFQAIADASYNNSKAFYKNMNYIVNKYTCNKSTRIVVIINEDKYNDLYSYCQGLHYLGGKGSKSIVIDKVVIDTLRCFDQISVTQNIKK